jgi:hypothetical protein
MSEMESLGFRLVNLTCILDIEMKDFGILAFVKHGPSGSRLSGALDILEILSQYHSYGGFSIAL